MVLKLVGKDSRPVLPADFRSALAKSPKAKSTWDKLTPVSQMDFVTWIEAPKQKETRKEHIVRACDMLSKCKRRPCCYSIVPIDLYKELWKNPKAKANLSKLDAIEKRVFLSWVDSEKEPNKRKARIKKAILLLESGKTKV